jgi:fructose-1,6-bisphosphatase I
VRRRSDTRCGREGIRAPATHPPADPWARTPLPPLPQHRCRASSTPPRHPGEGPAIPAVSASSVDTDTTLPEYLALKGEPVEFRALIRQVTFAAKKVAAELRVAGIEGMLGATGEVNVQGETVQRLDEYANAVFVNNLLRSPAISDLVSEEIPEEMHLARHHRGEYALLFDPIDGSSNLDVNLTIGSIFSVRRPSDVLGPGHAQIAAGYVMYGPATVCVLAMRRHGVNFFTYDPTIGEFMFTRGPVQMPAEGSSYGVNEANEPGWSPRVREFVGWLRGPGKHATRYSGALVGDFHRILVKGGVYLYPADAKNKHGKLRLLYEAAPLAFIAEIAGGRAVSEDANILDVVPTTIHERVPLILGSRAEIDRFLPPVR